MKVKVTDSACLILFRTARLCEVFSSLVPNALTCIVSGDGAVGTMEKTINDLTIRRQLTTQLSLASKVQVSRPGGVGWGGIWQVQWEHLTIRVHPLLG